MKIYLNVLPQEHKKKLRRDKFVFRMYIQTLSLSIAFSLLFLTMGGMFWGMDFYKKSLKSQEENKSLERVQFQEYQALFEEKKQKTKLFETMLSKQYAYSKSIEDIQRHKNENIFFTGMLFQDTQAKIDGVARLREDVLSFQEQLKISECYTSVEIPIQDLVKKENIRFSVYLEVKEECLQYE